MSKNIIYVWKIFLIILFFIGNHCMQDWLSDVKIKNDLLNSTITFFSILFWFYIASLSIFVTSKYVSDLYKIEDKDNNSQTLLHKLLNNYKIWLLLILITIIYLLTLVTLLNQSQYDYLKIWEEPILYFFFLIIILNIFFSYKMLWITFNIIMQESKNH